MSDSPVSNNVAEAEEGDLQPIDVNKVIIKEVSKVYASAKGLFGNPNEQNCFQEKKEMERSRRRGSTREEIHHPPSLQIIGSYLKHPVSMVHRKATVMVIGNVSAGKSTFINWYVQEALQKTGMAIETSGFTIITAGRRVIEIGGESALTLRPYLQPLTSKFKGLLENISIKTCPPSNGKLQMVDLIDTPGIADGELQYPFNIEETIGSTDEFVDLYLIFLDPIGQALGKRMLFVIEMLCDKCPDKVKFCLSKIDEIKTEEERIKITCQTTQSLTARISSRHGFDLIPIYVPGAKEGSYLLGQDLAPQENSTLVNRISDVVDEIQKVSERRVQDLLNCLQKDIEDLDHVAQKNLEKLRVVCERSSECERKRKRQQINRIFLIFISIILITLHSRVLSNPVMYAVGDYIMKPFPSEYKDLINKISARVQSVTHGFLTCWITLGVLIFLTIIFQMRAAVGRASLNQEERYATLLEYREFLKTAKIRWKQLNSIYLNHALNESADD